MSLNTRSTIGTMLVLAAIASGCGSAASISPAAPSGIGASPSQSGATISGRVTSATSSVVAAPTGERWAAMTNAGINVTVVGTSLNTVTDRNGLFTLSNVPSGRVQLRFSGQGSNAQVTLNGVDNGDRIEISVTLNGTAANVDSDRRSNVPPSTGGGSTPAPGNGGSLPPASGNNAATGTVSSLTGSCPAITFSLGSNAPPVRADASTRFDGGCSRVRNGVRVEVEIVVDADGRNLAKRITVED